MLNFGIPVYFGEYVECTAHEGAFAMQNTSIFVPFARGRAEVENTTFPDGIIQLQDLSLRVIWRWYLDLTFNANHLRTYVHIHVLQRRT